MMRDPAREKHNSHQTYADIRRAYAEFLLLPTLVIAGFLLCAVGMYLLDRHAGGWVAPLRRLMERHVFSDPASTSSFLTTIAGSVITVTSITFSLLLIAVQQSAGSLTSQVFDQFLRRPLNQIYLGFFVGLALYALVILAVVNKPFNPVLGATVCFILTVVGLYLLVILMYSTINEMRPSRIIQAIHDHVLKAQQQQQQLVSRTRRLPQYSGPVTQPIVSREWGFVTAIDIDRIGTSIHGCEPELEIELLVSIGSFVAFGDTLARVKAAREDVAERVSDAVVRAIRIEERRNLRSDPAFGIEQLVTIAWTSGSTAKQDLAPAHLTIHLLRDILARWLDHDGLDSEDTLPVVYHDRHMDALLQAFEAMAVVAAESHQYQTAARTVDAIAQMFDRAPPGVQTRISDIVLRVLPALQKHPGAEEITGALCRLESAFRAAGYSTPADRVGAAVLHLPSAAGSPHHSG